MEKILKWAVLFVVLVILASGAVAFYAVFFGEKAMSMPLFREMSVIDAVSEAEKLGLSVRIEQVESTLPPGRVLAQYPDAGAKIRGDKNLILKISRGGESRPIPDVRGIDVTRATRLLQEQGFSVGEITRIKEGGKAAGEVIAQTPASPANVPVNRKIDLLVSAGPDDGRFPVPDVAQMDEADAHEMLTSVGLKVMPGEKVRHRSILQGMVVNTKPAAGTLVKTGSQVRVFVSAGDVEVETTTTTTTATPVVVPGRETQTVQPNTVSLPGTESGLSELSVLDQQAAQRRQRQLGNNATQPERQTQPVRPVQQSQTQIVTPTQTTQPQQPTPTVQQPVPAAGKVAKIRYQVPPLTKPMQIKIEIVDPAGTRILLNRNARSNEMVQLDGGYSQEAVVTISLGGEFVWQEQFK